MATSGVNNTVKWELTNNILTISPLSGDSGIAKGLEYRRKYLDVFISLTDEEWSSVQSIVFTGDVSFYYQENIATTEPVTYSPIDDYFSFFPFVKMPNITSIDVSGLNTSGATSMDSMFSHSIEPQITSIIGLDYLDTSECENFRAMFIDLPLSSVDISSFNISQTANILAMFNRMKYCQRITLPQNFSRKDTGMDDERYKYSLGITSSGTIPITKDGVTITNDEDFFKLTSTTQGGTWERDLSGVATLSFKVTSSVREGNEATLSFNYLTTSATAEVYLKKSTDSSFPSSPVQTINLNGTGSSSTVLQLATDDAYDVMIIVSDGETTLYTYPSIDSNVLLFSIDDDGNVKAQGWAGFVQMFAGATAPSGWLFCDGSEVAVDDYPLLYAVIGDTYGTPSDSDHFVLPDLGGRFPIGANTPYPIGDTGGSADAIVPYHRHSVPAVTNAITGGSHHHATYRKKNAGSGSAIYVPDGGSTSNGISTTDTTHTHNLPAHNTNYEGTSGEEIGANIPPYLGINFIICTGETS